jgi:hypothetical protein
MGIPHGAKAVAAMVISLTPFLCRIAIYRADLRAEEG